MEKLHIFHPSMSTVVGMINTALGPRGFTEFKATGKGITIRIAGETIIKNAPLEGLSAAIDAGVAKAKQRLSPSCPSRPSVQTSS